MRIALSFVCLPVALASTGANLLAADGPKPVGNPAAQIENLWTRTEGVDWPVFLGPTGDSKSPETGILTDWPEEGLRIVWQTTLGTSYGAPSISRGRLFHFDRYRNVARLTCRHAETGEFLWKFEYPTDYEDLYGYNNGPRCCPVVDDDRVYIFGAEGMLHCLTSAHGELLWKVDTTAEFGVIQNFFGVGSAPVVEGDLLILMVGGSPAEDSRIPPGQLNRVSGNGSGIVAFDKRTGAVQYKITDELASYASPALATIDGRRWCFAFARGGLVGFEPATGQVDFQFPWRSRILESVNASNPLVVGDLVLISETYGPGSALLRVRPGAYDVVWSDEERGRDKALQTHWNTAVHVDGHVYGSSGRHKENAELRCIDLATGEVKWSQEDLSRSSLLYVDGHFVCLTETGTLLLLKASPRAYEPVAQVTLRDTKKAGPALLSLGPPKLLKEPAWAAPVLSHGLLYVRGADRLVCLELIPVAP
jgi:outer membrane protein assembly factor BamB